MFGQRSWWRRGDGKALALAVARAEAAERRLADVISAIPEGIVLLDADGRYLQWNSRYAEIYRRSADLFRPGGKLIDVLREGVARGDYPDAMGREESWLADRAAKLASADGKRHEQQTSDGRWLMIEERRMSDGGVIGLRVDITDMKRQAEALQLALNHSAAAQAAKADFLADMSHELRTPLNAVLGLTEALDATPLAPDQHALIADVRAAARQLDRLIDGLLDHDEPKDDADNSREVTTARPLRLLAADDNPANRKVIQLMLEAAGMRVVTVEDGAQAVETWRSGDFDAVLMDLRMPVMDGITAIREIRAVEAASQRPRTPMIVISANTSPRDREVTAAAGADGHLGKPIQLDALFASLEAAMEPRAVPAEAAPGP